METEHEKTKRQLETHSSSTGKKIVHHGQLLDGKYSRKESQIKQVLHSNVAAMRWVWEE
jgi:hypothetical protein